MFLAINIHLAQSLSFAYFRQLRLLRTRKQLSPAQARTRPLDLRTLPACSLRGLPAYSSGATLLGPCAYCVAARIQDMAQLCSCAVSGRVESAPLRRQRPAVTLVHKGSGAALR